MRDLAGVAALAVATLWIAYLVPHRLRHRQQLLESRTEDRFSGALRVLAVTDHPGRRLRAGEARAECGPGAGKRLGLLTPGWGTPVQGYGVVAVRGGGIVDRPHGTQDRISADAARRAAQQRAWRAASLARRGAAARRRAVLTVALLTLSAAGWLVVGVTTVAVVAAVIPTVALAGALVLGRRAVVQGRAADDLWERRRHTPLGAVRGTTEPVTGRAYHPSDARTEVIARVRDGVPPDAVVRSVAVGSAEAALSTRANAGSTLMDGGSPDAVSTGAGSPDAADLSPRTDDTAPAAEGWSPVPVPRPTYTTKAAAPRREPIPLVIEEAVPLTSAATSSDARTAPVEDDADADADASAPTPTLDLDAILARRRTAG